jgi:hypothetical protein
VATDAPKEEDESRRGRSTTPIRSPSIRSRSLSADGARINRGRPEDLGSPTRGRSVSPRRSPTPPQSSILAKRPFSPTGRKSPERRQSVSPHGSSQSNQSQTRRRPPSILKTSLTEELLPGGVLTQRPAESDRGSSPLSDLPELRTEPQDMCDESKGDQPVLEPPVAPVEIRRSRRDLKRKQDAHLPPPASNEDTTPAAAQTQKKRKTNKG